MSWGRVIGGVAASAAVAGCAALAIGMSHAQPAPQADTTAPTTAGPTYPQYYAEPLPLSTPPAPPGTTPATTHVTTSAAPPDTATPSSSAVRTTTAARQPAPVHHVPGQVTSSPAPRPRTTAPVRGGNLPLSFSTGDATRVITVTSSSYRSTTAWLQAWVKAPGGGWLKYGSGTTAHIGADGMSTSPSEYRSATPIGSYSLTTAFGALRNPGTSLPYRHTDPSYWWISQDNRLYNTMQSCWSNCPFDTSSDQQTNPNEHLYYETPYYNYAVVIDYNRWPAVWPKGSAFFLHVYPPNTGATAGCVAIPQSRLVPLMRWLTPGAHPRILIGVV